MNEIEIELNNHSYALDIAVEDFSVCSSILDSLLKNTNDRVAVETTNVVLVEFLDRYQVATEDNIVTTIYETLKKIVTTIFNTIMEFLSKILKWFKGDNKKTGTSPVDPDSLKTATKNTSPKESKKSKSSSTSSKKEEDVTNRESDENNLETTDEPDVDLNSIDFTQVVFLSKDLLLALDEDDYSNPGWLNDRNQKVFGLYQVFLDYKQVLFDSIDDINDMFKDIDNGGLKASAGVIDAFKKLEERAAKELGTDVFTDKGDQKVYGSDKLFGGKLIAFSVRYDESYPILTGEEVSIDTSKLTKSHCVDPQEFSSAYKNHHTFYSTQRPNMVKASEALHRRLKNVRGTMVKSLDEQSKSHKKTDSELNAMKLAFAEANRKETTEAIKNVVKGFQLNVVQFAKLVTLLSNDTDSLDYYLRSCEWVYETAGLEIDDGIVK